MHISFVHQPPSRTWPAGLKISSLKLLNRDKSVRLTRSLPRSPAFTAQGCSKRVAALSQHFHCIKTKTTKKEGAFMWSHSHADRYLHACPLETDVFKMLQEKESAPQGDSIGHKWFWHVVLFLNIEKKIKNYRNWQWCRCQFAMTDLDGRKKQTLLCHSERIESI